MTIREADRQGQLLDIARRLFANKGYAGTSLRDIASEAGITKAALYHHFPNKEALYERVVLSGMRALYACVEARVAEQGSPTEKIRAFMAASAEYFDAQRDQWIASSTAFWSGGDVAHRSAAVQVRDAYEALLRQCIAEGVACGELSSDLNPALAGKLLLSALNQLPRWHKPDGPLSAVQVIDAFADMILLGIAQPCPPARKHSPANVGTRRPRPQKAH